MQMAPHTRARHAVYPRAITAPFGHHIISGPFIAQTINCNIGQKGPSAAKRPPHFMSIPLARQTSAPPTCVCVCSTQAARCMLSSARQPGGPRQLDWRMSSLFLVGPSKSIKPGPGNGNRSAHTNAPALGRPRGTNRRRAQLSFAHHKLISTAEKPPLVR